MRPVGLLILLLLLAGCDALIDISSEEYTSRAQVSMDKGDLRAAEIDLKNALIEDPDNTQARWTLGILYLDTGRGDYAEKELRRALELGISEEALLPLLARAYLLQGKYQEVLDLEIGPSFTQEARADIRSSRGQAYLLQNEPDKAQQELEMALQTHPTSAYALVEMARLYLKKGDLDEAHGLVDKAMETDTDYTPAWGLRGDLYRLQKNRESAIEAYSKAIENSHYPARDLKYRALVYLQQNSYEQAQKDVDRLKNIAPKHPETNYMQGLLYFQQERLPEAKEAFELTLRVNPDHKQAIYYLGVTDLGMGAIEQADINLSNYLKLNPLSIPGHKMLAVVKLKLQEYEAAEKLIRPVVGAQPEDVEALNILAKILFYQGKTNEMIPLMERIATIEPDSATTLTRMGIARLQQGEQTAGIENLERATEIDPEFKQAELLLALNYLSQNLPDKALQTAEAFAEKHPDIASSHNLLAISYLAKGMEDRAIEALQNARETEPGDPFACRKLAVLAAKDNRPEDAKAYLMEILDHHEGHLNAILLLVGLEEKEQNYDAMQALLKEAIENHPRDAMSRVFLAREYLRMGKPEQVFVYLDENILAMHRKNPLVVGTLGEAALAVGDFRRARDMLKTLIELRPPGSPQVHYLLAMAYGGLNDRHLMKKELETALELQPDHLKAGISLTRMLVKEENLVAARTRMETLKSIAGNHPDVLSLEGEILARSGETEKALPVYQKLFEIYPTTKYLLHLTQTQWALGKRDEALANLKSWITNHPEDMQARLTLAEAYSEIGRDTEASEQYEKILEASGDNPVVLNDMAWHLKESDPERALSLAEKAREKAPGSISIADTMTVILLEQGDTARARLLIDDALEKDPASTLFLLRKAALLEATGQKDKAIGILGKLLENNRSFPERAEAELMLSRLQGT